jgi:hypothetical protein
MSHTALASPHAFFWREQCLCYPERPDCSHLGANYRPRETGLIAQGRSTLCSTPWLPNLARWTDPGYEHEVLNVNLPTRRGKCMGSSAGRPLLPGVSSRTTSSTILGMTSVFVSFNPRLAADQPRRSSYLYRSTIFSRITPPAFVSCPLIRSQTSPSLWFPPRLPALRC